MELTVISIKASTSGKSEVISLQGTTDSVFGESKGIIYSHAVKAGTCKVAEGQVINVDMNQFVVESNELTYQDGSVHASYWLKARG